MGGSSSVIQSVDLAQYCHYTKADFQTKIDIIRDAHSIVHNYADLLLLEDKMPIQLPEYKNYMDVSENYFNTRRKDTIQDLQAVNPKIRNYYDFFNALSNLQSEYEKSEGEKERRSKVRDVFEISYVILRLLIEELWESCDEQGRPPVEVLSDSSA
uniref:Uncharacterized protein n=1 Tax=viral metagenome TaxID=1070528 RepID=A0A6C0H6H7_9ZZZZ